MSLELSEMLLYGLRQITRQITRKVSRRIRKSVGRVARSLFGSKPNRSKRPLDGRPLKEAPLQLGQNQDQAIEGVLVAERSWILSIEEFAVVQLSTHTARAYRKDLEDFFLYLKLRGLDSAWQSKVGPREVADFRNYLSLERKLQNATVTRKLAVLKSFFRWSEAAGYVDRNPAELVSGFPQTQDSKTGFLDGAQIQKMLSFASPLDSRLTRALWQVVVEVLLMLGLRRSEAVAIRLGDFEFLDQRWLIAIRGKGERTRRLPVPERLLRTLSLWFLRTFEDSPAGSMVEQPDQWQKWFLAHRNTPLLMTTRAREFHQPMSSSEVGHIVRKVARRVGLVQRVSPHMLRATAITHALDRGASHRGVQQMAGWTTPLMIARYDKRKNDPKFSAVHHLDYAKGVS